MFKGLFGGNAAPAAPAPAAAPATTETTPTTGDVSQHTNAPSPTPVVPAAAELSGLDQLASMFSQQDSGADAAPFLDLAPERIAEVAGKLDFSAGVSDDMVNSAMQGDAASFRAVMTAVAQNAYKQSMEHSLGLGSRYTDQRSDFAGMQASKGLRGKVIESQMDVSTLPPAAQTMFKNVAAKVSEQYPTATAEEVRKQTISLMQEVASAFDFKAAQTRSAAPVDDDWSALLGFNKGTK